MELNKHIKLMYKIPFEVVFLKQLKFDGNSRFPELLRS